MSSDLTTVLPPELASINDCEPREALDIILSHAVKNNASDIFLNSNPTHYVVCIRRLGTIRKLVVLSLDTGIQVLHLIKSAAGMDLAERRMPLDGRWSYQIEGKPISFRANSMGTLHGEDIVLRVLPTAETCLDLRELGFVGDQYSRLRAMLTSGSGLLLVTGPTGAGKSTTLYSCLEYLNDGRRMISTLEDPIEHVIKGIRQCQIQPKIGLGFLELLRGILRQSPDVIMIGEIRDEETARTAVRAANSGHLVLSTLHAPLAAGAIQSMLAYGVNPFFFANSLLGIVAQRLIRKLSTQTRKMYDVSHSPETFRDVKAYLDPGQGNVIYGPDESDPNSQSGYSSQSGLFEIMTIDRHLRDLVSAGENASVIHKAAVEKGMIDFTKAALLKVAQGVTGVEEMSRVIPTVELSEYD
ncbi:MAG: type II/IV secretion system protein [Planctomycetales bacterium]|nr:type II/IV secretion system protein [Planctomycetales bacterium]